MKLPLYEQLYGYIIEEIKQGRLKSGDRVPSEKELAEQFKVSRITSKKALEKLMQTNVIERVRGKGSFVAQPAPDQSRLQNRLSDVIEQCHPSRQQRLIGLILPDFSESYGLSLVYAIERRCAETHTYMLLKRTYGSREEEERAIQACLQIGVDGLIIFPVHGEFYNADLLRLVLNNFPLVLIDRYLKGIAACTVRTDNQRAAHTLTMYLLERGHTEIAFLSPPPEHTSTIEERIEGYTAALAEHGLRANYWLTSLRSTLPTSFHGDNIRRDQEHIRAFIEQHPQLTAFVACEHNIALNLEYVLSSMNKHVPEDYAIVCFDAPHIPFGTPRFTHIQQDEVTMGDTAVDLLWAKIAGEDVQMHHVIDFRLLPGRSTGDAPILPYAEPVSTPMPLVTSHS
jgi:DNA-binding LacI/PurR family transcriptional regulator